MRLRAWLFAVLLMPASSALAQEDLSSAYRPSSSDFGGMGLLQTRNARFAADGNFDVGFSRIVPYERYLITIQALPWLEGTFRYTSVTNRDFAGGEGGDIGTSFKDRGADLKFHLVEEGRFMPSIALGLQDGLGTGVFAGEYLVASKRYYDFDFSLGLGWGYLAGSSKISNPLINLSDAFKNRAGGAQQGGTLLATDYFSGANMSIFGGIEYATPLKGLSLKLEYDPNDYRSEPLNNPLIATSHLNYGVVYEPFPWINMSLARERGNQFMFRLTLRANFNDEGIPKFDPPPPALKPRPAPAPEASAVSAAALPRPGRQRDSIPLLEALQDDGLYASDALIQDGSVLVRLNSASQGDLRRASQIASAYLPSPEGFVTVSSSAGESLRLSNRELQEQIPVDFMFDEFDRHGVVVSSIEMNDDVVSIVVPDRYDPGQIGSIASLAFPSSAIRVLSEADGSLIYRHPDGIGQTRADVALAPAHRRSAFTAGGSSGQTGVADAFPFEVRRATAEGVFADAKEQGLTVDGVELTSRRITVYLARGPFREVARNLGRTAIIAANHAPASVEEIEIVSAPAGMETNRVTIRRSDLERAAAHNGTGSPEEIWAHAQMEGPASERGVNTIEPSGAFPGFTYSIAPALRQHIGSGDRFYLYQAFLRLSAGVQITRGFGVDGAVGVDLYNNFDRLTAPAASDLPKVRSDIKQYLQKGENNLIRLQANYLWSPYPDFYLRATAGFFEENYGGYGGEFLYRPFGGRFAGGIDLNYVRQRDFDQLFSFRDYTVLTGHLNLYYDLPFYDLLAQMHIGQYLAGDRGATFQVSRQFDSGIRAGAFFTLTNVPFDTFGEGSFDKGFFLTIPLDLFSTRSSRSVGLFAFRPLTRDGGQRVTVRPRLYDVTAGGNLDSVNRDWDRFLE